MSLIDQAMKANEQFAKKYDPKLGGHPQPKIAVVTCMDPRLSDLDTIVETAWAWHSRVKQGREAAAGN